MVTVMKVLDCRLGSGNGGGEGLPRRKLLGDLKIPARISQAQERFRDGY